MNKTEGVHKMLELDEVFFDELNINKFYEKYYEPRIPVLIKEGASNWALMEKWNLSYLEKKYGNYLCTVVSDSRPAAATQKVSLKKYFRNYKGKSTLTLQKYVPHLEQAFLGYVPIPNLFFSEETIFRFFYYHSLKDAGTLPHRHKDAFNILQSGSKQWVFHDASPNKAPSGFEKMIQFHKSYPSGAHAKDWFENELINLPKSLPNVQVYQCTQQAGDIVYIPLEYSHTVLNLTEVMGVVFECERKNV